MSRDTDPHGFEPEIDETAELMEAAASQEEALLAEASRLSEAPGLDRVDAILDGAWRAHDRARGDGDAASDASGDTAARWLRHPFRKLVPVLAAAGVALVVFLALESREDPRGPGPSGTVLGEGELAITTPAAGDDRWTRVTWSGPAGERFRVAIVDPATDRTLLGPHTTGDRSWRPEWPADVEEWPERVLVRIEIHRPGEPHAESVEALVRAPR